MQDYPRIAGINFTSFVDGPGVRTAIFFSGCDHACPGCQNPETHDPCFGKKVTKKYIEDLARQIASRPYVTGITLTGGDPLYNPEKTYNFMHLLKKNLKKYTNQKYDIWMYTGYTWEELLKHLDYHVYLLFQKIVDVLVDGRFVLSLADKSLAFRGSSNQRIIDVNKSFSVFGRRNKKSPILFMDQEDTK